MYGMSQYLDFFHITYFSITIFLIELVTVIHVLMNRHNEPQSAILWMLLVFYLPVLGIALYIVFGINRVNTRGMQIKLANELIHTQAKKSLHKAFARHYKEQKKNLFNGEDGKYPDFLSALDRLLPDTLPLKGNSLELLRDGTTAYPRMLDEISKAVSSIHLQSFIIMNDHVGREILEALEAKAKEGVEVKVLYDRFGSMKAGLLFKSYGRKYENFQIHPFAPLFSFRMPWTVQLRNHRKVLVIDGKTAFIGGINISSDNDSRWSRKDKYIHDLHSIVRGPAVGELQYSFIRDWFCATSAHLDEILKEKYFPILSPRGNSVVRVVGSGPGQAFEATEKAFMAAVATAKRHIWIITPYFVPEKSFWKALCTTVSKGVEIKIIVPKKNNHWYVQYASQSLYPALLESGIRIFEKEGSFSHAKAMLVDGEWAYMGSSNCDVRSFKLNFELDFAVFNGSFINDLHSQFLDEISKSEEVRLEDLMDKKFFRILLENFCSLLTPVL